MNDREKLIIQFRLSGLSDEEAEVLADDYLAGRLTKRAENQEPPERCEICGFERIHVYPTDDPKSTMAVCLHCGSHYHAAVGWLDPDGL